MSFRSGGTSSDPVEYDLGEAFRGSFESLWEKELFSDVTVFLSNTDDQGGHTVGETLRCHRIVLSAWSPVLKDKALEAKDEGHPGWFSLKDMDNASVRTMITAFYKEKLELTLDNVWGVRKVAVDLKVEPAVKMCNEFINSRIGPKKAVPWAIASQQAELVDVETMCLDMIAASFNVCSKDKSFVGLSREQIFYVLDSPSLLATSEYSILVGLLAWGNHNMEEREEIMPELLKRLRYKLMPMDDQIHAKAGKHGFPAFSKMVKEAVLAGENAPGMDQPRGQVIQQGVQHSTPVEMITRAGWKLKLAQPYSTHTKFKDLEAITGKYLLVAASKKKERNITLCAMGRREIILKETSGNTTNYDNGVYWYFNPEKAFGFSPVPVVDLGAADQLDLQGDKRLSWHLHKSPGGAGDAGGFRVGMRKDLLESTEWIKLIFSLD
ncbi:hypothetical protein BSKO_09903 [Bryopsis sp. KO-2023]|nr:hypothetical protein BSKO_09903 [Bryopsis sp. KO-2023]